MNNEQRAFSAIDQAKSFFGRIQGEPLLPTNGVLLQELVHALEILWGYTEHELQFGSNPKSAQTVSDALKDGQLVARVWNEQLSP